ncbi:MAG: hypothetical protein K0R67_2997 [Paenibacillus sp.]|nr:hypothetical protein [Paenibacillus sp.]
MNARVQQALEITLSNWKAMSESSNHDESEATANEFEDSFYVFIDAVREWYNELDQRPQTLEELAEQPVVLEVVDKLPEPLHLNFETELELIFEGISRVDDEKYD